MQLHEVVVRGVWHNDSTGGFYAWCETCHLEIELDKQEHRDDVDVDDEMTFDALAAAVAEHRAAPVHESARSEKYSWFIYHPPTCWCGEGKEPT